MSRLRPSVPLAAVPGARCAGRGAAPLCPSALGTHSQLCLVRVCMCVCARKGGAAGGQGSRWRRSSWLEFLHLLGILVSVRLKPPPSPGSPPPGKEMPQLWKERGCLHWRPGSGPNTWGKGGLVYHSWQSALAYKPALSHKAASLGAAKQRTLIKSTVFR